MYILCKNRSLNQSLVLMRLAVTVNLTHVCKTSVVWQVFLDEVNTSSCLGLFKEIIVDRTFDGNVSNPPCHCVLHCVVLVEHRHEKPSSPLQPIPNNVFIVAACNPHRGNSLASHRQKKTWVRGAYYVRQLHPTLHFLMWDYGSLDEDQEREYINVKMKMHNSEMPKADVSSGVKKVWTSTFQGT